VPCPKYPPSAAPEATWADKNSKQQHSKSLLKIKNTAFYDFGHSIFDQQLLTSQRLFI